HQSGLFQADVGCQSLVLSDSFQDGSRLDLFFAERGCNQHAMLKLEKCDPRELTFKARVERFWEWYAQQAARFYPAPDKGESDEIVAEVSEVMEELLPNFA